MLSANEANDTLTEAELTRRLMGLCDSGGWLNVYVQHAVDDLLPWINERIAARVAAAEQRGREAQLTDDERRNLAVVYGYELGQREGAADERERIAQAIEAEPWERWSNEGPPSSDQAEWLHGVGCGVRFAARIARSEPDMPGGEGS